MKRTIVSISVWTLTIALIVMVWKLPKFAMISATVFFFITAVLIWWLIVELDNIDDFNDPKLDD